jgi:hypothetical protein
VTIRDKLALAIAQNRVARVILRDDRELVGVPAAHPTWPRWFGFALCGGPTEYVHQYDIVEVSLDL